MVCYNLFIISCYSQLKVQLRVAGFSGSHRAEIKLWMGVAILIRGPESSSRFPGVGRIQFLPILSKWSPPSSNQVEPFFCLDFSPSSSVITLNPSRLISLHSWISGIVTYTSLRVYSLFSTNIQHLFSRIKIYLKKGKYTFAKHFRQWKSPAH